MNQNNYWEVPALQPSEAKLPEKMMRFSHCSKATSKDAICFFEEDELFEKIFDDEAAFQKALPKLKKAGSLVQPDHTVFYDKPLGEQLSDTIKRAKATQKLQSAGLKLIFNLRWGDQRSFDFVFAGIPKNQVCCLGMLGWTRNKERRALFQAGIDEALYQTQPKVLLVYGDGKMVHRLLEPYESEVDIRYYPTWREQLNRVKGVG